MTRLPKTKSSIQNDLTDIKTQILALQTQINNIQSTPEPTKSEVEPLNITPDASQFLLKATMGAYDADSETVDGFSYTSKQIVDADPSRQKIFEIGGGLNGISISREKARLMRDASNRDELWVHFSAKPYQFQFEDGYYTSSTHEETVYHNGPLPSGKVLAARAGVMIVSALTGGDLDVAAAGAASIEDKPTTKTVTSQDWHAAQIVRTGWSGACSDAIIIYDHSNSQWTKLWEKTQ